MFNFTYKKTKRVMFSDISYQDEMTVSSGHHWRWKDLFVLLCPGLKKKDILFTSFTHIVVQPHR